MNLSSFWLLARRIINALPLRSAAGVFAVKIHGLRSVSQRTRDNNHRKKLRAQARTLQPTTDNCPMSTHNASRRRRVPQRTNQGPLRTLHAEVAGRNGRARDEVEPRATDAVPYFQDWREAAHQIKRYAIANLDKLLVEFEQKMTAHGATVLLAKDAAEANQSCWTSPESTTSRAW